MSELTTCNYCNHRRMLADAKRCGQRITLLPKEIGTMTEGMDVFMHPKKLKIEKLTPAQRTKFWKAWFGALTDHCVC
jgi:hypothetical protein